MAAAESGSTLRPKAGASDLGRKFRNTRLRELGREASIDAEATVYTVLGIDPNTTLPDFGGRPTHLLDDHYPIKELIG